MEVVVDELVERVTNGECHELIDECCVCCACTSVVDVVVSWCELLLLVLLSLDFGNDEDMGP